MLSNINKYTVISSEEHERFCDDASRLIYEYLGLFSLLMGLYETCGIRIPPPFGTNFRDSLFHYKKLYESDTVDEVISQYEAIEEHLSRAIKDSLIQLAQVLLCSASYIYSKQDLSPQNKETIQKFIHRLKQAILNLQLNSMNIIRVSDNNFGIGNEIIAAINEICQTPDLKTELMFCCSKYEKKITAYLNEI